MRRSPWRGVLKRGGCPVRQGVIYPQQPPAIKSIPIRLRRQRQFGALHHRRQWKRQHPNAMPASAASAAPAASAAAASFMLMATRISLMYAKVSAGCGERPEHRRLCSGFISQEDEEREKEQDPEQDQVEKQE